VESKYLNTYDIEWFHILRQGPNKSRTKAKAITKANKRGGGWKVGEMESGNWGWCWAVGGG